MAEVSTTTRNKLANGRHVAEAGQKHGPEATVNIVALCEQLGVSELDQTLIDAYLSGIVALLIAACDQLEQKEDALVAELGDDAPIRLDRDESTEEIRGEVGEARAGIKTIGGAAQAAQLGVRGALPRVPSDVLTYVRNFEKRCREHGGSFERLGMTIDLVAIADQLGPKIDRLEQILGQLVTEKREEQLARDERDNASELEERVYRGVAHILYGHLLLGGRDALAERLRPSERRASGLDAVDTDEEDPTVTDPEPQTDPEPVVEG